MEIVEQPVQEVKTSILPPSSKKLFMRKMVDTFVSNIDVSKEYSLEEVKKIATDAYKSCKKTKKVKADGEEKRKPSEYNLFVKEQMQKIKAENPTKDNKEIMSLAASLWKEHKKSKE